MKRAWPYALALAVVVTGCYLALAPLLRSLSPAPTTSAASPLTRGNNVTTVGKSKGIRFVSPQHGNNGFVSNLAAKKTKKAKKSTNTTVNNFATNPTSTSTTPRTIVKTPKKSSSTASSATKTPSKPKGPATVGGTVDATPAGGGGLAGGNGSTPSDFGQSSDVGP